MKRPTTSKLRRTVAECHGCGWTCSTSNALGIAARHHDSTGHVVTVDVDRTVTYGDPQADHPTLLDAIEDLTP